MKRDRYLLLRGIGIGIIITATLFYLSSIISPQKSSLPLTDTQIIEKARELGMIFEEELEQTNEAINEGLEEDD